MSKKDSIEKILNRVSLSEEQFRPELLYLSKEDHQKRFIELTKGRGGARIVDFFIDALREHFAIRHPQLYVRDNFQKQFEAYLEGKLRKAPLWYHGCWVFFPWKNTIVHILEENNFQEVKTARNKLLITPEEQKIFYKSLIVTTGLSIGNSVITTLVMQGVSKRVRLADYDYLSLSNLNRIRRGVDNLGVNKCVVTAREIYEINPFAVVEIFPVGLNKKNIDRFLSGADIVVDEMDDFPMKVLLREKVKRKRVAVVSGIDNAERVVIDIERYDMEKNVRPFNNRIGHVTYEQFLHMSRSQIGEAITQLVGYGNVPKRMRASLAAIGKEIVTWPQLGSTALLNGAAMSFIIRRILSGDKMPSGRILISLDENSFARQKMGQK